MDFSADGTSAGHAYWLYGVTLREPGGSAPLATADVRSLGFGRDDPPAGETTHGAGVLSGGTIPAIPYTSQAKAWGPAPSAPVTDALDVQATNVAALSVDARRARVDCSAALHVSTDGPLKLTLTDCPGGRSRTVSFG